MTEEKKSEFTVTDRRKFTMEGDVRPDVPRDEEEAVNTGVTPGTEDKVKEFPKRPVEAPAEAPVEEANERISAAEQQASADAYRQSSRELDRQLESEMKAQGRNAKDFEMNFEKLVASLYTTALVQLGMDPQSGAMRYQPDIMAARQTVDMLAILNEKTKGNLTSQESRLLENVLYELRMAYIEITKILTQPPAPGEKGKA